MKTAFGSRTSFLFLLATTALLVAGSFAACTSASDDCELNGTCNGTTSSSGTGGDGGGGGTPAECVPADASGPIDGSCGLFVSADAGSDDTGDGSQAAPYATVAKGLDEAGGRPVYVCVADYGEAVIISEEVDLFGGLSCLDWSYTAEATRLNGPADTIVLTVQSGGSGTRVMDFAITAADAETAGGSSIAALVDGAAVELTRCELTAGDGAAGEDGPVQQADPAFNGDGGLNGGHDTNGACVSTVGPIPGGTGGVKTCAGIDVAGGNGGNGINGDTGNTGGDGLPQPMGNPPNDGLGGIGQTSSSCGSGHDGADGDHGPAGDGAAGPGAVTASGYQGTPGVTGTDGSPGQGAGGGGGARYCGTGNNFTGPSGGGGGSGGCGGVGGPGGGAGGSSIALISVGATVTLTGCTLTASAGAAGGDGSNGQPGGAGGMQGNQGGANACPGGVGGQGGHGGSGGGGLGGHSLGVAYTGDAPVQDTTAVTTGTAGDGGLGGDNNIEAADPGADGQAAESLTFG